MSTQPLVLVADDEPRITKLVSIALTEEGFRVVTANGGEEALQKAEEVRPDIVLLDIVMPDLDGIEVMRQLRERRPVAVILLTAKGSTADKAKGLDLGADDYMAKPFAMPELVARVRALIRRSQAQSGPRIVHGPLALDTVARRAFLRGAPLDLAAREWAVLEVLLARVERIVSKESIIQAVASWGDELSPNAIEVYVSRLRAKLEPAGVRIRTVRGFGYMLEEYAEAQ